MSKLIFRQDTKGSPNGIAIVEYKKGQICNVIDDLAEVFLDMGVAEIYKLEETNEIKKDKNQEKEKPKVIIPAKNKENNESQDDKIRGK